MHGKNNNRKSVSRQTYAEYINLTDYAKANNLTLGEDKERNTLIIDEEKMRQKLSETIDASQKPNIIVDGHYASAVTPAEHVPTSFCSAKRPERTQAVHGEMRLHRQQNVGKPAGGNH